MLDPTDGTTFWAANEYIGSDGDTDIWRTHIASFSLPPAVDNDWYSVNVAAGSSLSLQSSTPSDQGGQFINTADVNIELYNTFGNLVAVGSPIGDGRNEALFYNAPVTGQYFVHVFNDPGTSGEYFLSVNTAQYQSGDISGQVYNDLNGSGTLAPGDPGLDNWEVDVYDSKNNFVASQLSHGGGYFDIAGLAPGTYKVSEILQSGWTETQPAPKSTYKVTVTAGQTTSGLLFGNFQNIYNQRHGFQRSDGNWQLLPRRPGPSRLEDQAAERRGQGRGHHDDRQPMATTASPTSARAPTRWRKCSRKAGSRLSRRLRARTASPRPAARIRAGCSSATSSS